VERPLVGERGERRPEHTPAAAPELFVTYPGAPGGRGRDRPGRDPAGGGGEPAAGLRQPDRLEEREHRPGFGVPARKIGGVLRVDPDPPRRDEGRLRQARRDEVAEDGRLLVLQGRDRRVPAHRRLGRGEQVGRVVAPAEKGDKRGDEIEDERRVGHVPEVDDAADPVPLVEQRVVERQVVVDHLRAEAPKGRCESALEAVEDLLDERPAALVGHEGKVRVQLRQVLDVPQDGAAGHRVEVAAGGPA
jgi:hypothetical protein